MCVDEKEKYLVISFAKENYILVTNLNTLDTVHTLYGHKARILSINFDMFYRKLVSLSRDKTVKIWELDKIMDYEDRAVTKSKFKVAKGPILTMAYCKFSMRYATAH